MTAPITRAEAIAQGLSRYFTGAPCKHGHVTQRITANGTCCECYRKQCLANYHGPGHAKKLARKRAYAAENCEVQRARAREWAARNPQRARAREKAWRKANIEKVRMRSAAAAMRRNAGKRSATPPWLTDEHHTAMQAIYGEALRRSSGEVKFHVDHIFPLKGRNFSGLHVPWNLQILEARANSSKSNKFPEEFREWSW